MHLAASPLSAARPLAPYLRIATQRPSPPTQPQARPRTAAALRPHGLQPSIDRKHGPASNPAQNARARLAACGPLSPARPAWPPLGEGPRLRARESSSPCRAP